MNAANLGLRFLLELAALGGFGFFAWQAGSGPWRVVLAVAAVIAAMTLWAVFAVPGDPSRSGGAPVPVPGAVRLALELAILLGGAWAWHAGGQTLAGAAIAALVLLHYALSFERIAWLLRQ